MKYSSLDKQDVASEQLLDFARAVWCAAHDLITTVDHPLQVEMSLSFREVVILSLIKRGVTRPSQLVDALGITAPTVSRAVEGLEHRGFVVRSANRQDRRAITLSITEKGLQIREEALQNMTKILAERFSEVDSKLLNEATATLRKINIK